MNTTPYDVEVLKEIYNNKITEAFNASLGICVRRFRSSNLYRVTVMFPDWDTFPCRLDDSLRSILKDSVQELLLNNIQKHA